ncbi:MAG TPA: ABC transporter permease [Anaerolineaceae bacterium]|nr:ABC transporter permease [Chloroflexota bacterium]HNY83382.1 ABC transporter permease [Anaerolineaceae bacterium]
MNLNVIVHAGISTGTILLIAAIGEILTERAGIKNLGVEGMMLLGAMAGFKIAHETGNVWLGLLGAIFAGGILSLLHGLVTISFQADQTVSGLSLTFLGTGLALVMGEGLTGLTTPVVPNYTVPILSQIPYLGEVLFTNHNLLTYFGYLLIPISWFFIFKTKPGLHIRAVGEKPAAADTLGVSVYRIRYLYTFIGGCFAGLAGAAISIAISPGWYSHLTTSGQGWIAIALVIFAQWNPTRAALGGYLFGMLRRLLLDLQGPAMLLGGRNPFFYNHNLVFFLQMMPYALTVLALLWGSSGARRKRLGAPAALGEPYVRGERGL